MSTFSLPDLGEGLQEAEIVAWHVGVGDHVVTDQPLVSVETEKAVVEVPSPESGRIAKLFADVGDILKTGAPVVEFGDIESGDTGTVVGTLPEGKPEEPIAALESASGAGVKAAPAVRQLAERLGVDLATLTPTGTGGHISKADVERAAANADGSGATERLRGVRRAMAKNMERAHVEVVPATVTEVADIGDWLEGVDVTMRLIRAIVAACRAEPALNAWYFGRETGRRLHRKIDLGVAMDTEDGLFVPVLRNVGERDSADLRQGLEAMKRDVTARTVPPGELRGQTITLSNFGMFGGIHAALVVLPPQVAIIGAGRICDSVAAKDGSPVVRPILPLSLTFDHRAVMGGEASRFLAAAKTDLEQSI
jgi:2-oxoisovalerate dehydrogenase E2 component (dihydrolipoyl transacylase)